MGDEKQNLNGEKKLIQTKDIKLVYPIVCIGNKIFQEEKPGVLHLYSVQNAINRYTKDVKYLFEYYLAYCNEPSHTEYRRVINDKYNLYKQIPHVPKEGDWANTRTMIEHIFGDGDGFVMGMEYCWNLYMNPKQALPFLGLVSETKNTGKSTFLRWLMDIFQENVSVVNADAIKSNFTASFANSLLITSDEHAEGGDRIKIAQKMKSWITEDTIRIEAKGIEAYTGNKYFKIVFTGNDEEMMTFIEKENTRYWINRVPPLDIDILDFKIHLRKEIPAFLYHIKHEFKAKPSRGRLYYGADEIQTDAGKKIQMNSVVDLQRIIEGHLKELFEQYEMDVMYYDAKTLLEDIGKPKTMIAYMRSVLKDKMDKVPSKINTRRDIGARRYEKAALDESYPGEDRSRYNKTVMNQGRYYAFYKNDYLDSDETYTDGRGNEISKEAFNAAIEVATAADGTTAAAASGTGAASGETTTNEIIDKHDEGAELPF